MTVDGDTFHVYGMSRRERAEVMAACRNGDDKIDADRLELTLLTKCIRDESGQRLFSDDEVSMWDDVPAQVTSPLVAAVIAVNGLDAQDTGRAEKN